jgi:hypothetical protein
MLLIRCRFAHATLADEGSAVALIEPRARMLRRSLARKDYVLPPLRRTRAGAWRVALIDHRFDARQLHELGRPRMALTVLLHLLHLSGAPVEQVEQPLCSTTTPL